MRPYKGDPQQGHAEEEALRKRNRQQKLEHAFRQLEEAMHESEGTQAGSPYGTREMAIAGTHLDTAWLWAREALE